LTLKILPNLDKIVDSVFCFVDSVSNEGVSTSNMAMDDSEYIVTTCFSYDSGGFAKAAFIGCGLSRVYKEGYAG
jgi:hypothetical protein